MPRPLIIAIDGPSGAGKGTVSRRVAEALGYRHVDTGVMYRVVAWQALQQGLGLDDEPALAELAGRVAIESDGSFVRTNGVDVTQAIRTPTIDGAASAVSRLPRVREALVRRQRAMGAAGGIVMEGRDIGTVVFPDADVKIYLDASPDVRARRRVHDRAHAGNGTSESVVAAEMQRRDRSDSTRAASPLTIAAGAVVIDTTALTIEEVVERVLAVVRSRDQG